MDNKNHPRKLYLCVCGRSISRLDHFCGNDGRELPQLQEVALHINKERRYNLNEMLAENHQEGSNIHREMDHLSQDDIAALLKQMTGSDQ